MNRCLFVSILSYSPAENNEENSSSCLVFHACITNMIAVVSFGNVGSDFMVDRLLSFLVNFTPSVFD